MTAIRLKPDFAAAHSNLGNALRAQGKLEEAIAAFRDGDPAPARPRRGPLQPRHRPESPGEAGGGDRRIPHGDPAPARRRRDPQQPRPRPGSQGKLEEAIAAYREAIRLQPDYADAHTNLGIALHAQGKLEEAIAAYRTAIRLQPDDARPTYNLGTALQDQGKLGGGDRRISHGDPAPARLRPRTTHNLGTALFEQGKLEEAVAEYREAIRLQPDSAAAHSNLGYALESRGNWRRRSPCTARRSDLSQPPPPPITALRGPWRLPPSIRAAITRKACDTPQGVELLPDEGKVANTLALADIARVTG